MPKCVTKFKKLYFLNYFPHFWGKNFISPKNPALSSIASIGFLISCQNLEKNNDPVLRKHLEGRTEGQTEPSSYHRSSNMKRLK